MKNQQQFCVLARKPGHLRARRAIAAFMAAGMAIHLAACGGGGSTTPTETPPPEAQLFNASEVELPPECTACADPYQPLLDEDGEYTVTWPEEVEQGAFFCNPAE